MNGTPDSPTGSPTAFAASSAIFDVPSMDDIPVQSFLNIAKLIIGLVSLVVAAIGFIFGWMIAGKIVCACIFAGIALVCLTIVIRRKWLLANLIQLEEIGYLLQEETMINSVQARSGLMMLQDKIQAATQRPETSMMPELIKHMGPLITLLVKKEQSKMSWAVFGFKLAKAAFDVIKQRK